jgi:hypothetical protein
VVKVMRIFSSPKVRVRTTSWWPGLSSTCSCELGNGVDADSAYLKRTILEVLLDISREILVLLHVLLHGDFALQLCDKLIADCQLLVTCRFALVPTMRTATALFSPRCRHVEGGCESGHGCPCRLERCRLAEEGRLWAHRFGGDAGGGPRRSAGKIS